MTDERTRLLIADDDARWEQDLQSQTHHPCQFAQDLHTAMHLIDRRRRWTGAIFDRYLLSKPGPFATERVERDAGFILAAAFLAKFPRGRIAICSGETLPKRLAEPWLVLLNSGGCTYVCKTAADAARDALAFASGQERRSRTFAKWLRYLLLEPNFCGLGLNLGEVIADIRTRQRANR